MAVRARKRLVLSTIERARLAERAARPSRGRPAVRAAIILACAEGQPDTRIAAQAGVSRATVAKWRARFMAARLAGLRDAPRPGTPRKITDAQVRDVLARTRSEPPPGRNHWTTRTMAAASGLSQSAVSRIWRSAGDQPGSCEPGDAGDNEGVGMEQDGARQNGQTRQAAAVRGVAREAAGKEPGELPDRRFLDREESWLRFNQRVLELAEDERVPLLERVRFLSIFASNLDEFFMVRVAGRIRRMATGLPVEGASGLAPGQILTNTLETARDLEVDEDVTEDLMQSLERELQKRRFEPAIRLEVEDSISSDVLDKLVTELGIDHRAVYHLPGPLDLSGLSVIADLDLPELKYPAFVPSESALPQDIDIFTTLARQDVLVHHPYDSFTTSVERLIEAAATDPGVLAIKQTLYRTSDTSPIVDALIDAAEAGKQVVVVVELKARFDERANIIWARKLEESGCHVVYGIVGLKTHCKMALVVREEPDGTLRRYCHVGTGNYHPTTARLYEDFGLLTAERTVGEDVTDLFNHLTGYSRQSTYRRFLVAPAALRAGLVERIEQQQARHARGERARIQLKCNSIIDEAVIDALYRASIAGVPVDLWVRGICGLRPQIPGLSETIRVRSVLGRFLEHSRIYAFGHGDDPDSEVWIGSADLMHRNLDRRVEALVRVKDPAQQAELHALIDLAMDEGTGSWWLDGDGTWTRHHLDPDGNPLRDLQQYLIANRRTRPADG